MTKSDPAASYWLKAAITDSGRRDPVDALADAEALVIILQLRLDALLRVK